jgi:transposase
MIAPPLGVRVWLATGVSDMRRGMNGLALQVQQGLQRDPHGGDLYVFRGRRGDLLSFIWPSPVNGVVPISAAQLGYMLEGIDWRNPQRTWRPEAAG